MAAPAAVFIDLPYLEIDVRTERVQQRALAHPCCAHKSPPVSLAQKVPQRTEARHGSGAQRENRDRCIIGVTHRKDESRRVLKIAFIDDQERLEIFRSCCNNGAVDEPGRGFGQVGNDHTENVKISTDQVYAASRVSAAQLCPPVQPAQDLANDLHAVAYHMTGAPFDAVSGCAYRRSTGPQQPRRRWEMIKPSFAVPEEEGSEEGPR